MNRSASRKQERVHEPRLLRNPDLLMCWADGGLRIKDLETGREIEGSPDVISVLDAFSRPRDIDGVSAAVPDLAPVRVVRTARKLRQCGLLLPENEGRRRKSR